jgi:hypothetical protein
MKHADVKKYLFKKTPGLKKEYEAYIQGVTSTFSFTPADYVLSFKPSEQREGK